MSSLKNASKSRQRIHRERHQPASRSHLGNLEKKKDYARRAKDHHRKQNQLKSLRKKALNKNPDEFYFHMINSGLKDGAHFEKEKPEEYTDVELKLMHTQDLNYVNFKKSSEANKIAKMQAELHLIDCEKPLNKHTIFVESKRQANDFQLAKHLDTHPDLLERTYNRPRLETLQKGFLPVTCNQETIKSISQIRSERYKELEKRIQRKKTLIALSQKMTLKKQLLNKKDKPLKKVKDGSKETPPIYLWRKERKR